MFWFEQIAFNAACLSGQRNIGDKVTTKVEINEKLFCLDVVRVGHATNPIYTKISGISSFDDQGPYILNHCITNRYTEKNFNTIISSYRSPHTTIRSITFVV